MRPPGELPVDLRKGGAQAVAKREDWPKGLKVPAPPRKEGNRPMALHRKPGRGHEAPFFSRSAFFSAQSEKTANTKFQWGSPARE